MMDFNFVNPISLLKNVPIGGGYSWGDAMNVTFCGIVIVFSMLVQQVILIKLFGMIYNSIASKSNTSEKETQAAASIPQKKNDVVPQAAVNADTTDDEIIAVIAAAVDAMYEGTGIKPTVRSVRSLGAVRSVWAHTGIVNNTRAF